MKRLFNIDIKVIAQCPLKFFRSKGTIILFITFSFRYFPVVKLLSDQSFYFLTLYPANLLIATSKSQLHLNQTGQFFSPYSVSILLFLTFKRICFTIHGEVDFFFTFFCSRIKDR